MTKIFAVAALATSMGMAGSAWADCGLKPSVPDLPADGATVSSKEIGEVAKKFDEYQAKFVEFNECATKEFNDTSEKFKEVLETYSAKNKKK